VPGAVITSILSVWVQNITVQIIVFILISAAFIFLCRKYFNKTRAEKLDDTANKLIGKKATVQTAAENGETKVLVGDVYWRAVSDSDIEEGETVIITAVNGNVLTVDKK
jgi:membrane protein implicated in regulation of membrane protease activity